jgi:hypothetical protein
VPVHQVPQPSSKRKSKAISTPEWSAAIEAIAKLEVGHAVEIDLSEESLAKITRFQFRRVLRAHLADKSLRFNFRDGILYVIKR